MSTPASERPRLPDDEDMASHDQPDLDRDNAKEAKSRIPKEDEDARIPDQDE